MLLPILHAVSFFFFKFLEFLLLISDEIRIIVLWQRLETVSRVDRFTLYFKNIILFAIFTPLTGVKGSR